MRGRVHVELNACRVFKRENTGMYPESDSIIKPQLKSAEVRSSPLIASLLESTRSTAIAREHTYYSFLFVELDQGHN